MNRFKIWAAIFGLIALTGPALGDTLLPNGKQQFFGVNGVPLIGGTVSFFIPGTSTPKATFQDSAGAITNTNPVVLDSLGSAIIYGSGCYRQIVQDASNVLVWDQLSCDTSASGESQWGGISTGTANVQAVLADNFSTTDGQQITFQAGLTNTSSMTLTPSGTGVPLSVVKDTSSGNQALTGGDVVAGNIYTFTYSSNTASFHVTVPPSAQTIPTGSIMDFAGPSAPSGWLFANGQCYNISSFPNLFTVIGHTYEVGACGGGQFAMPDYRARASVGVDNMGGAGTTARLTTNTMTPNAVTLGGTGGVELGTISVAQLPSFTPSGTVDVSFAGAVYNESVYGVAGSGTGGATTVTAGTAPAVTSAIGPTTFTLSMNAIGGANGFPVVQPTLLINKIIKQ